jgi:hypothetical protein
MNRHYYVSDNLDDLEQLEMELEASGISREQIHVLTQQDAAVDHHEHLHQMAPVLKTDILHSGRRTLVVGIIVAALILLIAGLSGWTDSPAGWMPFIMLAAVITVFSAWEGGIIGARKPNYFFRGFQRRLRAGRHLFFVDVQAEQEPLLERVVRHHPHLEWAGMGDTQPNWLMRGWQRWQHRRRSSAP